MHIQIMQINTLNVLFRTSDSCYHMDATAVITQISLHRAITAIVSIWGIHNFQITDFNMTLILKIEPIRGVLRHITIGPCPVRIIGHCFCIKAGLCTFAVCTDDNGRICCTGAQGMQRFLQLPRIPRFKKNHIAGFKGRYIDFLNALPRRVSRCTAVCVVTIIGNIVHGSCSCFGLWCFYGSYRPCADTFA